MRALCGAIITAGALIGLGLAAIGIGVRYQPFPHQSANGEVQWILLKHLDTGLMVVLVALVITLLIGLGISFLGLAYHHHRRHHELLRHKEATATDQRVPV